MGAPDRYNLAKDDFFIAMQMPLQKEMFAPKGVCCDTTHGTNSYDFSLTTILAINEYGQGFPAAWCLSSHEDFTTMTIFPNEIKKNTGDVNATFFMSNMAPQFYNAWVAVMSNPRPIKLICAWHVDKAWKEELRKKISDLAVEVEVYKLCCSKQMEKFLRTACRASSNVLNLTPNAHNSMLTLENNGSPKSRSGHITIGMV